MAHVVAPPPPAAAGEGAGPTATRYSPDGSFMNPKKPLPSVVVLQRSCEADSMVTVSPSNCAYPMTLPVAGCGLRGAEASSEKIGGAPRWSKRSVPRAFLPDATAATKSSFGRFGVGLPGAGE